MCPAAVGPEACTVLAALLRKRAVTPHTERGQGLLHWEGRVQIGPETMAPSSSATLEAGGSGLASGAPESFGDSTSPLKASVSSCKARGLV